MSWLTQPRTLDIAGAALPVWQDMPLFTVSRLAGSEKLGRLYDYTVEVPTHEPRADTAAASTTCLAYANVVHRLANILGGQVFAFGAGIPTAPAVSTPNAKHL
jgi:type VI secretion system secreted protein VgrG